MLGKLSETVSVHCVPTLQVYGGLLTAEQVILLTDGTRPVQCLLRVFMYLKLTLDYACIALITVREVIFATLSADATPVTVVVLFMRTVCIVNHTLWAIVLRKLNVAHRAATRHLDSYFIEGEQEHLPAT
jgi:hypothetical protein